MIEMKAEVLEAKFDLPGRVAIVTGAGQGIGKEISLCLGQVGAYVVLVDKMGQNVEKLHLDMKNENLTSIPIEADVARPDHVEEMVKKAISAFERIDILVNNAGIRLIKSILETNLEDWNETLQTNLTGAFLCSKAVIPQMIRQQGGKIINISSCGGLVGIRERSAYCASKSGMIGFTRSLAAELGEKGICVNAIAPGVIETSLTARYFKDPQVVSSLEKVTPQRRWGQPKDVAFATLYLASDAANFITGAVLSVDGGFSMTKEF